MFTFSQNLLNKLAQNTMESSNIVDILNLQGQEVKAIKQFEGDKFITIEVKANRPDLLSHIGVLRELEAYYGKEITELSYNGELQETNVKKVRVQDDSLCNRYSAIEIRNINNIKSTPLEILNVLHGLGIELKDTVTNICNYMTILIGQPVAIYDSDKIGKIQEIEIKKTAEKLFLKVSNNQEYEVPQDTIIVVCNDNKLVSIAGIIVAKEFSVDENTKNITIECGNYNDVLVRLSSRKMKLSTLSSFRLERGVDYEKQLDYMLLTAKEIQKICGGIISNEYIDYGYKQKEQFVELSINRTNSILGINLNQKQVKELLEKYNFHSACIDKDILRINVPSYRLDLGREIDFIEEVARIFGYHNIEPKAPIIRADFVRNRLWENMDKIRNILVGLSFYEMINYGFIPVNSMEVLGIEKGDEIYSEVLLQNPISANYALMRPTLLYSLLNNAIYNTSKGSRNLALFEIGKIFYDNNECETHVKEKMNIGILFTGIRIPKGWGIDKNVKYSIYDISNYLNIIFGEFGLEYELKRNSYKFCEKNTGMSIIVENLNIGYCGQIKDSIVRKIQNGKLMQSNIFYIEFNLDSICERKKMITMESKYPPIIREYNLLVKKEIFMQEVITTIRNVDLSIKKVQVLDIYEGKEIEKNKHAVLIQIVYMKEEKTLTADEVEKLEEQFLQKINEQYSITLK